MLSQSQSYHSASLTNSVNDENLINEVLLQDKDHAHEINLPELNSNIRKGKHQKSVQGLYSFQRGYKPFRHSAVDREEKEIKTKATDKEQKLPEPEHYIEEENVPIKFDQSEGPPQIKLSSPSIKSEP